MTPDLPSVATPWLVFGTALVAFLVAAVRYLVLPVVRCARRVDHTMATVEAELCVNGDEREIAHPEDHGLPLRTLVLGSRGELRKINERLEAGGRRFASLERRMADVDGRGGTTQ